jgi:hypothetical protein
MQRGNLIPRQAAPWASCSRGHSPAGHPVRLTSRNSPSDQEGQATRARGTPPTRRDGRVSQARQGAKNQPKASASDHHIKVAKDRG